MTHAPRARTRQWWIISAVALLVMLGVVVALLTMNGNESTTGTSTTPTAGAGCNADGVEYIDLDTQVSEPASPVCFRVAAPTTVTVGAASLDPEVPIALTVLAASGDVLARDEATASADPEVTIEAEPGIFQIEITPLADPASPPPPYLIVTTTETTPEASPSATPSPSTSASTTGECPADMPTISTADEATVSADANEVCLTVATEAFVKVGVDSEAQGADLRLAIAVADDDRSPIVAVDDTFGTDPEISWDLAAGSYIVDVTAWDQAGFANARLYTDDTGTFMRQGEPSAAQAALSPDVCEDAPALMVGDAMTVDEERAHVCVTVDDAARLTMQAATLDTQDLVLEVLGFSDEGEPFRVAWADGNPRATSLADTDPFLDQNFAAGTWVIAVTDAAGAPGENYDIRVVETQP